MKIVSYYTADDIYSQHAILLKHSLDHYNLSYSIDSISPRDWLAATAYKPTFIKAKLAQYQEALLYIDVDAVVHRNIEPFFRTITEDIAVHYTDDGQLLSGVIYLQNSPEVMRLVDRWIRKLVEKPNTWDQMALHEIIDKDENLSVFKLPPEYLYIFDTFKKLYPNKQPVIEHLQASREKKYREKCLTPKRRVLHYFGVRPRVGELLKSRRQRMRELLTELRTASSHQHVL